MNDFTLHTEDTAPEVSKAMMKGIRAKMGFLPNLLAGMAEAPTLLEGYTTLASIFDKSNLSPTERQIILMTNNRLNGCHYCMAAHTTIAQGAKVSADVIESLRNDTPIRDEKLEALRQFAARMNETRGWVDEQDLNDLFAAGYDRQTVLEVILGTSLKVMSNYTNHVAGTPLDEAFQANAWSAQALA